MSVVARFPGFQSRYALVISATEVEEADDGICDMRPLCLGAARSTLLLLAARPRAICVAAAAAPPKRVVFLGTPNVAARALELIQQGAEEGRGGGFEIAAVVSQPPAKTGRKMKLTPSPVHKFAEEKGLQLMTPPNAKDEEFLSALEALKPDLCITAAYGCFLPQRFLDAPKHGTLNIHPSLLPLYRGAAPVQRSLENGDAVTGVSVAFTVLAMDAGPLVRQEERVLDGDEQAPELLMELFETGTDLLLDALPSVWDGSCEGTMVQQNGEAATKAPKIKNEEAEVISSGRRPASQERRSTSTCPLATNTHELCHMLLFLN